MVPVRQRILLIDDDLALLEALPRTLQLSLPTLTVEGCDSPSEAINRLAARQYHAVISDIRMPSLDGLSLMSRVRRLQPNAPILLITGTGDYNLARLALELGAYDFLLKPFERDAITRSVEKALGAYRLRARIEKGRHVLSELKNKMTATTVSVSKDVAAVGREKRTDAARHHDARSRRVTRSTSLIQHHIQQIERILDTLARQYDRYEREARQEALSRLLPR